MTDLQRISGFTESGDGGSRPAAPRRNWHRLYYLLAAFDLLTVSVSFLLSHRLVEIHTAAVSINREWAGRLSQFSDLAALAGKVNAPGNDVFDSLDADKESARLARALREFTQALDRAENELRAQVSPAQAAPLLLGVGSARTAMDSMVREANLIFSHVRDNEPEKAGKRMATMDRKLADLTEAFSSLSQQVWDIQSKNFQDQQDQSESVRRYERLIAIAIVIMVISVAIYGHKMSRMMGEAAKEREEYLTAARNELEERVALRTADLTRVNEALSAEVKERERTAAEAGRLQERLLRASRAAGMAEVATGVLHNVGNVLNSVNVSVTLLQKGLSSLKAPSLLKTAELIKQHEADLGAFFTSDPRGKKLPAFLMQLADYFWAEQENLHQESLGLGKNLEHIKDIVTRQQSYARVGGVSECLLAEELVKEVLNFHEAVFKSHGIEVIWQSSVSQKISVDRHKALQILLNLISNAQHAIANGQNPRKVLAVGIERLGSDKVRLMIRDSGMGIAPENLTKIFQHGFTTKKEGHGFGLHSSANAAREMGGDLTACSEGLGMGAVFFLDLPIGEIGTRTAAKSTLQEPLLA